MNKKKSIIMAVIVLSVIFGTIGCGKSTETDKTPQETATKDKYETIAYQNDSYIQYRYDFSEVTDTTKEYTVEGYKVVFKFPAEGMPSFQLGKNDSVESLAYVYDVFYLIKTKSVVIANHTDFGTGMYYADGEAFYNLCAGVKGAYEYSNFKVKGDALTFDAQMYSDDDYCVTLDDNIFSVNMDDYTQFVEPEYPAEVTFKTNLSKEALGEAVFEAKTTKTIEKLYEEISKQYE